MPIVPIENVGRIGIVADDKPHNLPPEAWTDGKNVRFFDNAVRKSLGQSGFSGVLTALTEPVYKNSIVPTGITDWDYPDRAELNTAGDRLLIGAVWAPSGGIAGAGQVYYYDIGEEGQHSNERLITPDTPSTFDNANFGTSLSMSADGTVIAIGAYTEKLNDDSLNSGGIYIFNVDGAGNITQVANFSPRLNFGGQYVGISLELSDDGTTLVVGATGRTGANPLNSGHAYVYEESGGTWTLSATLTETTPVLGAFFGIGVAISGDATRIAVSSRTAQSDYEGEVHIFKVSGGTWPIVPDEVLVGTDAHHALNFPLGSLGGASNGNPSYPGKALSFSQDGLLLAAGDTGGVTPREAWSDFASGVDIWTATGTAVLTNVSGSMRITGSSSLANAAQAIFTAENLGELLELNWSYSEGNAPTKDLYYALGTAPGLSDILSPVNVLTDFTNRITSITASANTTFYMSVWLDGGTGSEYIDLLDFHSYQATGAVHIFEESGGTYSETEKLVPTLDFVSSIGFAWSLDLNDAGDVLHVGAKFWDENIAPLALGSVYTFHKDTTFAEVARIVPQLEVVGTYYGFDVSISGDTTKFSISDTQDGIDGRSITDIFAGTAEIVPHPPHWLLPWRTLTEKLWLYPGVDKCYKTDGTTHTEVTRYTTVQGDDDYDAGSKPIWTGGVLHGVPILNNNNLTDYPQQWDAVTSRLKNLENWPVDTYCRVMRTYKNFLIALDITKSTVRYPYMIKWSDIADPGTVPPSWDEADPTGLSGENTLAQSNGWILDCKPLGDLNIIYKQDSIWGMQHIGGVNVFRFYEITDSFGALAPRCIQEFYRKHFVVGTDDIVLMNGNSVTSIINKRMRKWFFNALHPSFTQNTIVAMNPRKHEMWVCFVENGSVSEYLTKALIWNWDDNTWSVKDLPDISFVESGVINLDGNTFDGSEDTFDAATGSFDGSGGSETQKELLFAHPYLINQLYIADTGYNDTGTNFTSYVERLGLSIAGVDRHGNPKADPSKRKFLRAVYPKISAGSGALLQISAGSQDTPDGAVTWEGPYAFDPAIDTHVDFRVSGNYLALRFEEVLGVAWEMSGYSLDLEIIGEMGR